jgi:hypothetical protein
MKQLRNGFLQHTFGLLLGSWLLFLSPEAFAVLRTNLTSGNWSNPAIWLPTGVPTAADDVQVLSGTTLTVDNNFTVNRVTVMDSATLLFTAGRRLTMTGNFTVNGSCDMNRGEITLSSPGLSFILGPDARFTWDPGTNDAANATLFVRGTENFAPGSTLIIKRWYNYALPLGRLVSSNFGNLTINTPGATAGTIAEWNQSNWFQTRRILGTLTVDQGWVTLDKSGNIGTTSIGSIVLTSVNSTFIGHSGTHPGSFTIQTGSLTNNGGNFFVLQNGNGNASLQVSGNVFNIGNLKIINNSGVAGVSNGNADFQVTGTFTQNTGDTRIIYNIATTNSGTFAARFGHLILNGGIFFGQTGVHSDGGTNRLDVLGQFTVQFGLPTDKFRGTSLSSIGTVLNNAGLVMNIGGNLSLSGPATAEFTTSAASGPESINISGNLSQSGLTSSFNFGTLAASHAVSLSVTGNLQLSGGVVYLSRNNGPCTAAVGGFVQISGGQLNVKGGTGATTLNISGEMNLTGGWLYLHNNTGAGTTEPVLVTVNGPFRHSSGTLQFETFVPPTGVNHQLILKGPSADLSGNGIMTSAMPGTGSDFGSLVYGRSGTMSYRLNGNGYSLQQVIQEIAPGCNLRIATGPMILSSQVESGTQSLRVRNGGQLEAGTQQLRSNGLQAYSSIQLDSGAVLTTARPAGLYDHANNGTIDATNNLTFTLHASSMVVYNGSSTQDLTGLSASRTLTTDQYYGILRIALPPGISARAKYDYIPVRTRLELAGGLLDLDGRELQLQNGDSQAVLRTGGGIISDGHDGNGNGRIVWKNMQAGAHLFPLSDADGTYLPLTITPTGGFGADLTVSSNRTAQDNRPLPLTLQSAAVTSQFIAGLATDNLIDRWWEITATGMTATVSFSYSALENTLPLDLRLSFLGAVRWTGSGWTQPAGSGMGITLGTGTVTVSNVSNFGVFGLSANNLALPIELVSFEAKARGDEVEITWSTAAEVNNDYFTVERSTDGTAFEPIQTIDGAGNSTQLLHYAVVDKAPASGISYYRLRQTDYDGKFSYSEIRAVNVSGDPPGAGIRIDQSGPNPFSDLFRVFYTVNRDADLEVLLVDPSGKPVLQDRVHSTAGANTYEFRDGASLAKGTYLFQLTDGTEKSSIKLLRH